MSEPPMPVVLHGCGTEIVAAPEGEWWSLLQSHLPATRAQFDALPQLHRAVRRAAVLRIVATGLPAAAAAIASDVGAPLPDVVAALAELERRLFFVVRDATGAVTWAFPVTAEATPHHLAFSTGERLDGA